jgi:hypothetical protein
MPYFIIFAIFVLYLFLMVIVIAVTILCPQCSHLRHYVTSFLIWSSLGFVTSIVVYFLVLFLSLKIFDQIISGRPSVAGGVVMGGIVFILPFVVSVAGLIGGGTFGLWRHIKKDQKTGQQATGADC